MTLKEGQKAPEFRLLNEKGKEFSLEEFNKKFKNKPLVLYFYPKDFTPGCTLEACGFKDIYKKIKNKAEIIGISADSVETHKKFSEKYDLPFTLLSDKGFKVSKSYKVYKKKNFLGRSFMGIERTTFIIYKGRIVRVFEKVKPKGHEKEVLDFINNFINKHKQKF